MKFDKPQKGNPHELTIKQHIFPQKSISRFINNSGLVQVFLTSIHKNFLAKPDDQIFCAMRVWDQRAEESFMKEIEDKYQTLVDHLVKKVRPLSKEEHRIVTDFYLLWNLRFYYLYHPSGDKKIGGDPNIKFSKDDEEILEKEHISIIHQNGILPSRVVTGADIQVSIFNGRKKYRGIHWSICESKKGEFVVPDHFLETIIPFSPTKCFIAGENEGVISRRDIVRINRIALRSSEKFCFAKSFKKCSGIVLYIYYFIFLGWLKKFKKN